MAHTHKRRDEIKLASRSFRIFITICSSQLAQGGCALLIENTMNDMIFAYCWQVEAGQRGLGN